MSETNGVSNESSELQIETNVPSETSAKQMHAKQTSAKQMRAKQMRAKQMRAKQMYVLDEKNEKHVQENDEVYRVMNDVHVYEQLEKHAHALHVYERVVICALLIQCVVLE